MQQNNLHAHVNKCACFHIESCPSASLTPISQTHNQVLFKCLHPLTLASPVRPNMSISPPDSKLHSTSETLPPVLAVPLDTKHRNVTTPHLPPCARQITKPRSKKKQAGSRCIRYTQAFTSSFPKVSASPIERIKDEMCMCDSSSPWAFLSKTVASSYAHYFVLAGGLGKAYKSWVGGYNTCVCVQRSIPLFFSEQCVELRETLTICEIDDVVGSWGRSAYAMEARLVVL
jgi:hypothetical protein